MPFDTVGLHKVAYKRIYLHVGGHCSSLSLQQLQCKVSRPSQELQLGTRLFLHHFWMQGTGMSLEIHLSCRTEWCPSDPQCCQHLFLVIPFHRPADTNNCRGCYSTFSWTQTEYRLQWYKLRVTADLQQCNWCVYKSHPQLTTNILYNLEDKWTCCLW